MSNYVHIRPCADLDLEIKEDAQDFKGVPALYCMKTGKMWPKPMKPYYILVDVESGGEIA